MKMSHFSGETGSRYVSDKKLRAIKLRGAHINLSSTQ